MTSPTTLPSIVDRFARFLEESDLSPITVKNYRADLQAFEKWFYETGEPDFDPAKITPTDLRQFRHFLLEERRLRPNTINRHLATLRSFLSWAASTGLMPDGRMPTMPRGVREVRPGPRWLDRRERMALLKAVERQRNPRDIAIVKLLLHTGLRVGELCSLTWRDVRITPRKGLMIIRNGKGQKRREIPLNRDVRNALLGIGYQEHACQGPRTHGQFNRGRTLILPTIESVHARQFSNRGRARAAKPFPGPGPARRPDHLLYTFGLRQGRSAQATWGSQPPWLCPAAVHSALSRVLSRRSRFCSLRGGGLCRPSTGSPARGHYPLWPPDSHPNGSSPAGAGLPGLSQGDAARFGDPRRVAVGARPRPRIKSGATLLLQLACEKLLRGRIVRPGISRLERMVATARQDAQQETFRRLAPLLEQERCAFLDQLLIPDQMGRTPLTWLREGARSNSAEEILNAVKKLAFLRKAGVEGWDMTVLNPNRLKFLAQIGRYN